MKIKQTSKLLTLEYPVEWNDSVVTEVEVRRPKGKDMRYLPAMNDNVATEDIFPFLSRLLPDGMTEEFIDEMDQVDLEALNEIVENFSKKKRGRARKTSAK